MNPIEIEKQIRALDVMMFDSHAPSVSCAPTPGYAVFRPVVIKCTECGCRQTTNGQMLVGKYEWECDACHRTTTHIVTEAA